MPTNFVYEGQVYNHLKKRNSMNNVKASLEVIICITLYFHAEKIWLAPLNWHGITFYLLKSI